MVFGYSKGFFDIRGLSSESKPVVGTVHGANGAINESTFRKEIGMGDTFFEIDTKKVYMNNGTTWVEV